MPDGGTLTIHLLGGFRITAGDQGVTNLEHARLQDLLAYLLLQRGRPVSRQHLAFLFWPDSGEKQARTNLRTLWHRLRRALPDAERFIDANEAALQWRSDAPYWLDVAEFEEALAQARTVADPLPHLEQAVALYGGELLPGSYHEWLLAERERLSQLYSRALQELAALHEERRQYRRAIAHARTLLRHDPLHEPAYALLMRLQALVDDRAAALHTYHTCVTVLRRELNVEPGHAIRELYERLLEQAHAPPSAPAQPSAPPLVGRSAEWARLQGAWREAAHRPRLALLSGEAGIGKTRLAEALEEWLQRQGIVVLAARCYAAEGDLPYAPVVAWLRSQPLPPLADPTLRELARLLPELLVERPDLPPPGPLTEGWQRLHLFQALAQALLHRVSAVLLVLEDAQWCDRNTLDWLYHVLTAKRGHEVRPQVLVAATLRSEAREEGSPVAAWQAQLAHAGRLEEIELGPLSPESTLALASHVAGQPLDSALGPLLYWGTEGNPLFIVEMVRAGFGRTASVPHQAGHAQAMLAAPTPLPARVRQVLEARLTQLSLPARAVIELAAVLGREFRYSMLARASDLSEDVLVGCLDECWRRRIIRERGEEDYDFSHDKLREVAYAGLSRTRRRWLHGQAAQALQAVHAHDLDFAAGSIAGHYEAAGRPGHPLLPAGRGRGAAGLRPRRRAGHPGASHRPAAGPACDPSLRRAGCGAARGPGRPDPLADPARARPGGLRRGPGLHRAGGCDRPGALAAQARRDLEWPARQLRSSLGLLLGGRGAAGLAAPRRKRDGLVGGVVPGADRPVAVALLVGPAGRHGRAAGVRASPDRAPRHGHAALGAVQ